ncbi:MAG TPA: deoxyhypusine synthase [Planctomycetota bacterium]|jgi:deoxyhypusine synthase|nr:deoxyhypusine synthase [Planctomycetota bacterium]
MAGRPPSEKDRYLSGEAVDPPVVEGSDALAELIDRTFLAYNAGRLREACRLLVERILRPEVTVGVSIAGALTPAGLGRSCLIPWIRAGFVDWIVSTGANLYHDAHYALGFRMRRGSSAFDDRELQRLGVVRIYDLVFDYDILLRTDEFFRQLLRTEPFGRPMSTAEFHHLVGAALLERNAALERAHALPEGARGSRDGTSPYECVLTAAARAGVPIYTSSPGDSSIGMNVAEVAMKEETRFAFDVLADVNETTALVYDAKKSGGRHAAVMFGGGSPKNFLLQTEPQIREVFGLDDAGHDYYLQVTDARADTGGLSGATPGEAVSWGKVDPAKLSDAVVVYSDTTIAMPLLTSYALARCKPRPLKRLYERRRDALERVRGDLRLTAARRGLSS